MKKKNSARKHRAIEARAKLKNLSLSSFPEQQQCCRFFSFTARQSSVRFSARLHRPLSSSDRYTRGFPIVGLRSHSWAVPLLVHTNPRAAGVLRPSRGGSDDRVE